jgi:hypothetical protein
VLYYSPSVQTPSEVCFRSRDVCFVMLRSTILTIWQSTASQLTNGLVSDFVVPLHISELPCPETSCSEYWCPSATIRNCLFHVLPIHYTQLIVKEYSKPLILISFQLYMWMDISLFHEALSIAAVILYRMTAALIDFQRIDTEAVIMTYFMVLLQNSIR